MKHENSSQRIRGKSGTKNLGQNSGRKIEEFGKLSFCNFSDLKEKLKEKKKIGGERTNEGGFLDIQALSTL